MSKHRLWALVLLSACAPPSRDASDGVLPSDAPAVPPDAVASDAAPPDAAPPDAAPPDAVPVAPACLPYPIAWTASGATEGLAQAELSALSPGAAMTWNADTGTVMTLPGVDVALDCPAGVDVQGPVLAMMAAHPALFQVDAAEWTRAVPLDCGDVTENVHGASVTRLRIGSHGAGSDQIAFGLRRLGGEVHLTGLFATYLPTAFPGLDARMTACATLDDAAARATVAATALHAASCAGGADVAYQPQATDQLAFSPTDTWVWAPGAGDVVLSGTRTMRVTIDPAHYTAALLASSATCPVPGSADVTVGFDVALDVESGAIVWITPGLDCVAC